MIHKFFSSAVALTSIAFSVLVILTNVVASAKTNRNQLCLSWTDILHEFDYDEPPVKSHQGGSRVDEPPPSDSQSSPEDYDHQPQEDYERRREDSYRQRREYERRREDSYRQRKQYLHQNKSPKKTQQNSSKSPVHDH